MKPQQARTILHSLTQGMDPESGTQLPENSIVLRSDVLRALYAAIEGIDQSAARAKRRAQLPQAVGLPWTPGEEKQLESEFQAGEDIASIAAKHQRTVRAIEARLERLGLITADQRTTRPSFTGGTASDGG